MTDEIEFEDEGLELDRNNLLAMNLWVKWRDNPEAQRAIPKKLIVEILCALAPQYEGSIRSGTGKYREIDAPQE